MCYCVCKPKRTVLNQLINTCMNDWSNLVVWEIYTCTCILFALSVGALVRKAKRGGGVITLSYLISSLSVSQGRENLTN